MQKVIVSRQGYNALTDTNIDHLQFSSDYNTLKYSLSNGSKSVTVNNNTLGYYTVQEEIPHNLGYKPFFKVYAYLNGYRITGVFQITEHHNIFLSAKVDENKMYFIASGVNIGELVATTTGSDLQLKYSEFENTWKDKFLQVLPHDTPGEYKYQCFDLVAGWTNHLGIPHVPGNPSPFPYANAYQIWSDFGSFQEEYFERIINTMDNRPPKVGDIVVWENAYNGAGGHTGVAKGGGNSSGFQCFVQNDPLNHNCFEKDYGYGNVYGWLRPKNQGTTTTYTYIPDNINFTAVFKYKIFKNNLNL